MGGECWAGMGTPNIKMENNLVLVDMGGIIREGDQDGIKAKNCVNPYIAKCGAKDKFCIGTVHSEYIQSNISGSQNNSNSSRNSSLYKKDDNSRTFRFSYFQSCRTV